jgi:altronate dehydratase small subunit
MPLSALVIDKKDNVATAVMPLEKGNAAKIAIDGKSVEIMVLQDIPFGHKLALTSIDKGTPIIKYGETVGLATEKIEKGEHVHVHNVEGLRGRGDKA